MRPRRSSEEIMKYLAFAAIGSAVLCTSVPLAQAAETTSLKMSQSDCASLWQQANSGKAAGLTESQASAYVTDFKAANPDGDATIDQSEWMAACSKGLVKASS